jgi:hypothetical protein
LEGQLVAFQDSQENQMLAEGDVDELKDELQYLRDSLGDLHIQLEDKDLEL